MKSLTALARELCDTFPDNVKEGWNWNNISDFAKTCWIEVARDQMIIEAWDQGYEARDTGQLRESNPYG